MSDAPTGPAPRIRPSTGGMKLSTSLFLLLLLSGCLPLLLVLLAGWLPLRQQLRLWTLPSVERALDASLRANRGTFFAIRRSLERRARAESPTLRRLAAEPDSVARNHALDGVIERQQVDLAQLWVERNGQYVCVASRSPFGPLSARGTVSPPARDPLRVGPAPPPWVPLRGAETNWVGVPIFTESGSGTSAALVLASAVGPGYFDGVEGATSGLSFYRRLEEVSSLLRTGYLLLFTVAACGALAVSLLLARRVARGVSQPVEQLVAGMDALGRGHAIDLSVRTRFPEILALASAFRSMGTTLRDYEERLRESEQVKGARETARFVAHEIRNSLTPVRASVSVLERRIAELAPTERDRARRALDLIQHEAERMTRLASAFSEYAHMPAPAPESLDLSELLARLAQTEVPESIEVESRLPEAPQRVRADRDQIERACRNLIKNAVEAMPEGGRLRIELSGELDGVRVRIADTGQGMDAETLRHALQPGFTTKPNGTGLGLALVRRTISQYGGRFHVESELGRGTTCELWLPAERAEESTPLLPTQSDRARLESR